MSLPPISRAQKLVIEAIDSSNVIVDSVAGSGKTTTNLYIAQSYPNLQILLLTYNKKLKFETREKVSKFNLGNMEVHSYHSFCVKYYDNIAFKDDRIKAIVADDVEKLQEFNYDLIILDEAQDMTPLYYQLVKKIYKDNDAVEAKLCFLGDKYQSIYEFNDADNRFIIYADRLFNFNNYDFKKISLSTSFRLTDQTADFLNSCCLDENRVETIKRGLKPRYIMCNTFACKPFEEIKYYIRMGYNYEDIFVLAPSVRSAKSPVRRLANLLSDDDYPIYVPLNDEEELDEDILNGKLVFSTFHQAKGLERKVVIIFGFDDSYFKFYKRDADPDICPNELYVALTRAIERMSIFHHFTENYLGFLNKMELRRTTNLHMCHLMPGKARISACVLTPVTEITRHLSSEVLDKAQTFFELIDHSGPDRRMINIPVKTRQADLYESVSEITGTAIPAYFEYLKTGKMSIRPAGSERSELPDTINSVELLKIANNYCASKSGYIFKKNQIKNYNWLTDKQLDRCVKRLEQKIGDSARFEIFYSLGHELELLNRQLVGYVDCVDDSKLWEFKCVKELNSDHYIQLALYAYLHEKTKIKLEREELEEIDKYFQQKQGKCKSDDELIMLTVLKEQLYKDIKKKYDYETEYHIYNILDKSHYQLKASLDDLTKMVSHLMDAKYSRRRRLTDGEFIEQITNL